jgi:hypothetical protein
MRSVVGCALLVSLCVANPLAQRATWHADLAGTALVESWDRNERREFLAGLFAGVDWRAWRGLAIRTEGVLLRVVQQEDDAVLGGFLLGTRTRWGARFQPYVDIGAGLSQSSQDVPVGGTAFNFLLMAGSGITLPTGRVATSIGGRWLHISNNGREGNDRNPDIQSLGIVVAIGWRSRD